MKFKTSLLIGAAAVAATSLLAVTSHAKIFVGRCKVLGVVR